MVVHGGPLVPVPGPVFEISVPTLVSVITLVELLVDPSCENVHDPVYTRSNVSPPAGNPATSGGMMLWRVPFQVYVRNFLNDWPKPGFVF